MMFILLPTSVYTLFIMRTKPNSKQNNIRMRFYCREGPAGLCGERSTSLQLTRHRLR